MKLISRTMFIGPLGLIVATAACGGGTESSSGMAQGTQAPQQCEGMSGAEATPDGNTSTQEVEPNGPRALLGASLQKVCLDDKQTALVESIGERVSAKESAVTDARLALRATLLAGLRAGQVDESALVDEVDALVKAREAASPVLRTGIEDLHGLLDNGQRVALAVAMQSRVRELTEVSAGWLDTLATDLSLSADQKQKIGALVAKSKPQLEEERTQAGMASDAFKKDDFAMDRVAPLGDVGKRMRARATGMVGIAKELTTILTPKQREDLAVKIEGAVGTPGGPKPEIETTGAAPSPVGVQIGQVRQPIVVGRVGGYRAGRVRGWGGGVVVASAPATAVVVVPTSGYVVGYPLAPGYGPGVW